MVIQIVLTIFHLPLTVKLNANRVVTGVLRGNDIFMNLVLEEASEEIVPNEKSDIGTVVIRGNSVLMVECLEKA
jgi:small nuclear ribonucleoprotein G